MMKQGRTLDLGCGTSVRNPYGLTELCGIDIYQSPNLSPQVDFRIANLTMQPLPFGDSELDVISAFDVIEHIPRVLPNDCGGPRFPFIDLMNEVWRALKPGGIFYALTPAYPHPEAFQDPTHVNIITERTHEYFCVPGCLGANYGFTGKFEALRIQWIHQKNAYTAEWTFRKAMRSFARTVTLKGGKTHLLWELRAIK